MDTGLSTNNTSLGDDNGGKCRQFVSERATRYSPIRDNDGKIIQDEKIIDKFMKLRKENNPTNTLRVGPRTPFCEFCAQDNTETAETEIKNKKGIFCVGCGEFLSYL